MRKTNNIANWLTLVILLVLLTVPSLVFAQGETVTKFLPLPQVNPLHLLAKVSILLAFIIIIVPCILALFALVMGFFPGLTERTNNYLQSNPFRSFILGFLNVLLLFLLLIVSKGRLGIIVLPVFLIMVIFGLIASSEDLGRRIMPLLNGKGTRFSRLTIGWVFLVLASLIPFLGWFIIFPWRLLSGIGAFVISTFSKTKTSNDIPGQTT